MLLMNVVDGDGLITKTYIDPAGEHQEAVEAKRNSNVQLCRHQTRQPVCIGLIESRAGGWSR
jgi:hypothetical protein